MYTSKLFENYNKNLNESKKLEEKRNPENDEANELIRTSLNDPEYAKNHTTELRKHGIKYISPEGKYDNGALEGKNGRRLAINTSPDWRKDNIDELVDTSYNPYKSTYAKGYSQANRSKDYQDLHQKGYTASKEDYEKAKKNIGRQRARVANMEKKDKEAGLKWNEKTYNARQKLKDYQNTIEKGIQSDYKSSNKIHPDTDLKGFLNAKKHSDRPLPREKDPKFKRDSRMRGRGIADPANKDVEDYITSKQERHYLDRERANNERQDKEDLERIEYYKQRAAEDKARRDSYLDKNEKEWKAQKKELDDKLDAYRKRMINK